MVREVAGSNPDPKQLGMSLACTCGNVLDAVTYGSAINRTHVVVHRTVKTQEPRNASVTKGKCQ